MDEKGAEGKERLQGGRKGLHDQERQEDLYQNQSDGARVYIRRYEQVHERKERDREEAARFAKSREDVQDQSERGEASEGQETCADEPCSEAAVCQQQQEDRNSKQNRKDHS